MFKALEIFIYEEGHFHFCSSDLFILICCLLNMVNIFPSQFIYATSILCNIRIIPVRYVLSAPFATVPVSQQVTCEYEFSLFSCIQSLVALYSLKVTYLQTSA